MPAQTGISEEGPGGEVVMPEVAAEPARGAYPEGDPDHLAIARETRIDRIAVRRSGAEPERGVEEPPAEPTDKRGPVGRHMAVEGPGFLMTKGGRGLHAFP